MVPLSGLVSLEFLQEKGQLIQCTICILLAHHMDINCFNGWREQNKIYFMSKLKRGNCFFCHITHVEDPYFNCNSVSKCSRYFDKQDDGFYLLLSAPCLLLNLSKTMI